MYTVTFSISHHNHWVIIVASTAFAVGCDIVSQHQSKEAYARIAAVCLSPDESMMYITGDDTYPVSIIWALKESYLKAIGVGLQMDMQVGYQSSTVDSLPNNHINRGYSSLWKITRFQWFVPTFWRR